MTERNIEEIRRKNLEDNQLFLKKLRIKNIRNDFVESTRSIRRKDAKKTKPNINYEKVERVTRYGLKVKSGEIQPYIPQWRNKNTKGQPSKWSLFYKNNANPYERVYKPRIRKTVSENIN